MAGDIPENLGQPVGIIPYQAITAEWTGGYAITRSPVQEAEIEQCGATEAPAIHSGPSAVLWEDMCLVTGQAADDAYSLTRSS